MALNTVKALFTQKKRTNPHPGRITRQMYLQMYADGDGEGGDGEDGGDSDDGAGDDGGDDGGDKGKEGKKQSRKTYTDEDVDKIIEKRFARWKKEQSEAEKLKNMTDKERDAAERKKLQDRIDELEAKETRREMASVVRGLLQQNDINAADELVDLLIAKDADSTKAAAENFTKLFKAAVSAAVKEAMKGRTPRSGEKTAGGAGAITREQIMKIRNPLERQRLIRENPDLFK